MNWNHIPTGTAALLLATGLIVGPAGGATAGPVTQPTVGLTEPTTTAGTEANPANVRTIKAETGWITVSANARHSCGIRTDGSLWCWGDDTAGAYGDGSPEKHFAPVRIGTSTHWMTVSAGHNAVCALQDDHSLWCWGDNSTGTLGIGTTERQTEPTRIGSDTTWQAISVGNAQACATKTDGSLWCWGGNLAGAVGDGTYNDVLSPVQIGTEDSWATVSAGYDMTCGTRTDNSLWCWGSNYYGGFEIPQPAPVQIAAGIPWLKVGKPGMHHTCAITVTRDMLCLGANWYGHLGDGTTDVRMSMVKVTGGISWADVVTGEDHTCGLSTGGELWCWGFNEAGQIAEGGAVEERYAPTRIGDSTAWRGISAGSLHTCATRTDDTLWCWGSNSDGALGDGTGMSSQATATPLRTNREGTWKSVAAHAYTSCAIDSKDELWCWGSNWYGTLGDGTLTDRDAPTRVKADGTWKNVSLSLSHVCAIRTDRTLWCWGENSDLQLGAPTEADRQLTPIQVGNDADWSSVSAGTEHTCAIKTDRTLWCWGYAEFGLFGDGTFNNGAPAPTLAQPDRTWLAVAVEQAYTCAISTERTLWCWGRNTNGVLGDGTAEDRWTATQVGSGKDWASISVTGTHACAIKTSTSLWCWGSNTDGGIGDGTTTDRYSPTRVGADSSWSRYGWSTTALGNLTTCATRTDNSLWCWGDNSSGAIGNGATADSRRPVLTNGGHRAFGLAAGDGHTCAIRKDLSLWCWGENNEGQLGSVLTTMLRQVA